MQQATGDPKSKVKVLRIVTLALVTGVVIFALIVVGLVQAIEPPLLPEEDLPGPDTGLYVAAGAGLLGLVMAFTLFNKKMNGIALMEGSLQEKLSRYNSTLILFMALCEGPALLSVIILFLTKQYAVLVVTAVMVAAMLSKLPTKAKVIELLKPDWEEQQQLE